MSDTFTNTLINTMINNETELAALKQQIIDLTRENTELKANEKLYVNFGRDMLFYVRDRFSDKFIAKNYKVCVICSRAHLGGLDDIYKCCLSKKQSIYGIYCPECWTSTSLSSNNTCKKCGSTIYKCNVCGLVHLDEDELTQCCKKKINCPSCNKLTAVDLLSCIFCFDEFCFCEICNKIYQTYEEETNCCTQEKLRSGDFIVCKSCTLINKKPTPGKPTPDKPTCKWCEEEL